MNGTTTSRMRALCLLTALLLLATACGTAANSASEDAAVDEATAAAGDTGQDAAAATEDADPDASGSESSADQVDWRDLDAMLGEVPEPSSDYRVAAIVKTLINEHWQEMEKGYMDAGQDLGVDVTVQAAQDEADLSGQLTTAETMLGQGFDIFSISPLSQSNLQPFVDRATSQDVPLLNVEDAVVPEANVFVGAPHTQMGVMAAELFSELLPDGGQVAQIEGAAGSPAAQQRIEGFTSQMETYDDLELVASVPGDWDRQTALDATANLLRANPDLAAIYANNDTMALGAVEALRAANKLEDVLVVGTDGVPDAIEALRSGDLTGTVSVFPYDTGRLATEVAIRLLEGQDLPDHIDGPMEMVTVDNVDALCPDNECRAEQ